MVLIAPIHHLLCHVASNLTQNYLSAETPTHGGSVIAAHTIFDNTDEIYRSGSEALWAPLTGGPYAMSVQWDDGPYEVVSFFRKANHPAQVSIGNFVRHRAQCGQPSRYGCLPEIGEGGRSTSLMEKSMEKIKWPTLRTVSREAVSFEGIELIFARMGDLGMGI